MFKTALMIALTCISAIGWPAHAIFDEYPDVWAESLQQAAEAEKSARAKLDGYDAQYLLGARHWPRGTRLLIAFNGGSPALHAAIKKTASEWLKYANLAFDFGYSKKSGQFRAWSYVDKQSERVAHIRISFEGRESKSRVGQDANDVPSNAATMFLGGFDTLPGNRLTAHDRAIVLHEFGHVLGLHHEHQRELCKNEIRWIRGANGAPSVYDVFKELDQPWEPVKVNLNLFPVGDAKFSSSTFDKASIMTYALPAQAFVAGEDSHCYIKEERLKLSGLDKVAARAAYSENPTQQFALLLASRTRSQAAIDAVKNVLTAPELAALQARGEAHVEAHKPLVYIHIQRERDRSEALKVQRASRKAGFYAPGIENVSGKGLKSASVPQVRYFRVIDADYATLVAKTLLDLGREHVRIDRIPALSNRVSRNLIEVWLP